jgi:enoyl-CoA hydratase
MGLVSRVVPDGQVVDEALATARVVAGYTSTGLTLTKEVMWHNLDNDNLASAIAIENRNQALASRTPEVQEFMANYSKRVKRD